jgi:hypothetical protein
MSAIHTPLTNMFGIAHPVLLAGVRSLEQTSGEREAQDLCIDERCLWCRPYRQAGYDSDVVCFLYSRQRPSRMREDSAVSEDSATRRISCVKRCVFLDSSTQTRPLTQ